MKSLRKKTLDAAKEGKADEAQANLKELSSAIDRALKNNVIHKNKAANLKSKAVKALRSATS
jgi:small subunit ribosomal protein S20